MEKKRDTFRNCILFEDYYVIEKEVTIYWISLIFCLLFLFDSILEQKKANLIELKVTSGQRKIKCTFFLLRSIPISI